MRKCETYKLKRKGLLCLIFISCFIMTTFPKVYSETASYTKLALSSADTWVERNKSSGEWDSGEAREGVKSTIKANLSIEGYSELVFLWKVSCEDFWKGLNYTLTGANGFSITDSISGTWMKEYEEVRISLNTGVYQLSFTYEKTENNVEGDERGYIKNPHIVSYKNVTKIPTRSFATKDQLIKFNTNGNGNDAQVYFGATVDDVTYCPCKNPSESATCTVPAGDIKWWISGTEDANSLVLYSAQPLSSKSTLFEADTKYDPDRGCKYSCTPNQKVTSSHYGMSNARDSLNKMSQTIFSPGELSKVSPSVIYTEDDLLKSKNASNSKYSVSDRLYLPQCLEGDINCSNNRKVFIGSNDSLHVSSRYWSPSSWTRTSYFEASDTFCNVYCMLKFSSTSLFRQPVREGGNYLTPACKIDLNSVLFASTASTSLNTSRNFAEIVGTSPMKLRYKATDSLNKVEIRKSGGKIWYNSVPSGSNLIVIGTDNVGRTYQISKSLPESNTEQTIDLNNIGGFEKLVSYQAWIEKSGTDRLIYSTELAKPMVSSESNNQNVDDTNNQKDELQLSENKVLNNNQNIDDIKERHVTINDIEEEVNDQNNPLQESTQSKEADIDDSTTSNSTELINEGSVQNKRMAPLLEKIMDREVVLDEQDLDAKSSHQAPEENKVYPPSSVPSETMSSINGTSSSTPINQKNETFNAIESTEPEKEESNTLNTTSEETAHSNESTRKSMSTSQESKAGPLEESSSADSTNPDESNLEVTERKMDIEDFLNNLEDMDKEDLDIDESSLFEDENKKDSSSKESKVKGNNPASVKTGESSCTVLIFLFVLSGLFTLFLYKFRKG